MTAIATSINFSNFLLLQTNATASGTGASTSLSVSSTANWPASGVVSVRTTTGQQLKFSYSATTTTTITGLVLLNTDSGASSWAFNSGSPVQSINYPVGQTTAVNGTGFTGASTSITVTSTTGFPNPASNVQCLIGVVASSGTLVFTYSGITATTFTGLVLQVGLSSWTISTGANVYLQPTQVNGVGFAPLSFTHPFRSPSYAFNSQSNANTSTTAVAPPYQGYPISINGRPYMVDTSFEPYRREAFRHKSLQAQRQSLHFTNIGDDGTVSTEGLWRREARDWSMGSGQQYFDRKKSQESRFFHSKGINPWMQWQVTLHNDVKSQYIAANSATGNVKAIHVGTYIYIVDGNTVTFRNGWGGTSTTLAGSTTITGTFAGTYTFGGTVLDICTDGYYVYVLTTTGVWCFVRGSAAPVSGNQGLFVVATTSSGTAGAWTANISGVPLSGIIAFIGGRLMLAMSNMATWACSQIVQTTTTSAYGASPTTISVASTTNFPSTGTVAVAAYNTTLVYTYTGKTSTTFTGCSLNSGYTFSTISTGAQVQSGSAVTAVGVPGANIFDFSSDVPHQPGFALSTTTPENLYTHPSLTWKWTGLTSGSQNIYMTGYNWDGTVADRGQVLRSGISANATATNPTELNYPVQALPLPIGEYPTAIKGYLNYIFIGTNRGIRMCEALNLYDPSGNAGDLKAGPLLPAITEIPSQPVTAIVGDDRYIYWAWNNFDDMSTGLGRLDLTTFIDPLAPAYASDLMVDGQGSGLGACTWLDWDPNTDTPLMSMNGLIDGNGTTNNYIYTGNPSSCVASGYIDSGAITYGLPDYKNAVRLDLNVQNVAGTSGNSSVQFSMEVDNNAPVQIGSYSNSVAKSSIDFMSINGVGQQFGEQYDLKTTLFAAVQSGVNISPVLNRWTLKALPGIPSGILISAVILLYEPYELEGQIIYQDPYVEYAYLESLRQSQQVVTYVEGPYTAQVTVDVIDWLPERKRDVRLGGYHGDLVVSLKTVTG